MPGRVIFLIMFLLCGQITGMAQTAASYTFNAAMASTYTSISGVSGAVPVALACDDCFTSRIPIGFGFDFCGVSYDSLNAASNGFITLADAAFAAYLNQSTGIAGHGFLMPFWDDLSGVAVVGSVSLPRAYYVTTGAAPNRVFTFEWQNFNKSLTTCTTCGANFQVRLYETTNVIEFVYGPGGFSGMSATIGIGNSYTDWQSLSDTGSAPVASSIVFADTLRGLPASGRVYRWQFNNNSVATTATIAHLTDIYPNPNNGSFSFTIQSAANELVSVTLTNLQGAALNAFRVETNQPISVQTDLPKGIYLLTMQGRSTKITKKVIVE